MVEEYTTEQVLLWYKVWGGFGFIGGFLFALAIYDRLYRTAYKKYTETIVEQYKMLLNKFGIYFINGKWIKDEGNISMETEKQR